MSDQDPSRRLDDFGTLNELKLVSREEAEPALSRTVEFLIEDCHIPHVSLIPYPVVFFILARWFHVHPRSEQPTRDLLARWVWRGIVTGAHQRAAVSAMREQVRDIKPDEEQKSLNRLLARVNSPAAHRWKLGKFHLKSAHGRIETLALLAQRPRDRYGIVRLGELVSGGRIAREIFPARVWSSFDATGQRLAKTAANRVLLGSAHTGLNTEISRWSWDRDQEALKSHLMDERSFEFLCRSEADAFLQRREEAVVAATERMIAERAAWEEPVLRPLSAYFEHPQVGVPFFADERQET